MPANTNYGTGRRKTSTARVHLRPGTGKIRINDRTIEEFFGRETSRMIVRQPLETVQAADRFDVDVNVQGGGIPGQAGAIRPGTLVEVDEALWRSYWELKVFGYINMTRAYYAHMKKRGKGVIVNIIGAAGERMRANYIAGSTGKTGAAAMSANSAMRAGSGLVTLAVPASLHAILETKTTEVMTVPLPDNGDGCLTGSAFPDIGQLLDGKDAVALGPGLGRHPGTTALVRSIVAQPVTKCVKHFARRSIHTTRGRAGRGTLRPERASRTQDER